MSEQIYQLRIQNAEFAERCAQLQERVNDHGASGIVLFDTEYILYYTGFYFIPTERPVAFIMNAKGERGLYVPRLELEHAQANAFIDKVAHYKEYPDKPHPSESLHKLLHEMNIRGTVLADSDGYPWVMGYRGPSLSESGFQVKPATAIVEDQMMIKSAAEINLLVESCKWGNLAHMLLQRYTVVGATETEVSNRACREATSAMVDAIGPIYRAQNSVYGAMAGYRGQIGRNGAIPHALANNITFQDGDVLVTGATAGVWGYVSELERTMFIGKVSDEQRYYFDHMLAVQDLAMNAIEPGKPCSAVDTEVRKYFADNDLVNNWKHHTGHAIGIRYHEGPFLDIGDDTEIKVGMVFTVEPGIYVPGLGGFRHSDTLVVTENGTQRITYYPRDLESLTLPA